MSLTNLPPGWTRWHEGADGAVILAYRPDVFDAQRFPAACMPTIAVKRRRAPGPRGRPTVDPDADVPWTVALRLEPDVLVERAVHDRHADAVRAATELAAAFAAGEVAYREAYQVPRETYLDALDELIGAVEE